MTPFERKLDRWLPRIVIPFFVVTMAGLWLWLNRGAFTTANDVVFADPVAAVRDARALIAARSGHMIPPHQRPHHDQRTRYRDVYFYRYDNDAPVTIDNLP